MLDKNLIKNNFEKSLSTYDDNATIQEEMASKLITFLKSDNYKDVLEIGSYSGILTKKIIDKIQFENYLAIDIANSYSYIEKISSKIQFQNIDIEKFNTDKKFDLIISNATLQWCNDLNLIIQKLKTFLKEDGIILISIFGNKNYIEIQDTFNSSLKYYSINELKEMFSSNVEILEDTKKIQFKNSFDVLKHIKYTGVNSISKNKFKYGEIKNRLKILEKKYKNSLTYNPLYIIYKKGL